MKVELRAIVTGKVQKVGFRWTVVEHAENSGLVGSVQNLEDGSVEIVAQGQKEELESFLKALEQNPGFASIKKITVRYSEPKEIHKCFTILR